MWIARDKDSELYMYEEKPTRHCSANIWVSTVEDEVAMPRHLFPELKWEDEPIEVEIRRKDV